MVFPTDYIVVVNHCCHLRALSALGEMQLPEPTKAAKPLRV